jgi:hypothetical protein
MTGRRIAVKFRRYFPEKIKESLVFPYQNDVALSRNGNDVDCPGMDLAAEFRQVTNTR